jgi:hypothetical protein
LFGHRACDLPQLQTTRPENPFHNVAAALVVGVQKYFSGALVDGAMVLVRA